MEHRERQGRSKQQYKSSAIGCFISAIGLILTLLLITLTGCEKEPVVLEGCLEESYPNMVCTMEVNYQCGCDGWVYINPCYATKNGVTKIRPYNTDDPGDNCNPW